MTKKQDTPEEAQPQGDKPVKDQSPPVSDWEQLVQVWADKTNVFPVAQRLRDELAVAGITSVDMIATAPIKQIANAARAALQADAQALQAAAFKIMEGK